VDIFIGNLPASATLHDIRSVCRKWDFGADFERKRGIYQIGKPFQYFVAHFGPGQEKEAERLVRQLKGASLHGRTIEVREYYKRSYSHERRALGWRDRPWDGVERRSQDRRCTRQLAA
jgi:hypothetical protein